METLEADIFIEASESNLLSCTYIKNILTCANNTGLPMASLREVNPMVNIRKFPPTFMVLKRNMYVIPNSRKSKPHGVLINGKVSQILFSQKQ
jgi:hypothetical protein